MPTCTIINIQYNHVVVVFKKKGRVSRFALQLPSLVDTSIIFC